MKKFLKVCGICTLILLGGGITLTVAGYSLVGAENVSRTVRDVTDGRFHLELDPVINRVYVTDYAEQEAIVLEQGEWAFTGQDDVRVDMGWEGTALPDQNIENLVMNVGDCEFYIAVSWDGQFRLEAQNADTLQADVEDKTLHIDFPQSHKNSWHHSKTGTIVLYVPQNFVFGSAEIELGAGFMNLEQLYAQNVKIEVGAGQIYIGEMECRNAGLYIGAGEICTERMAVGELEASVGMGSLSLNGSISDDSVLECGMGSITLNLSNNEKDFSYAIDCSLGNIDLNGKHYSGLANVKEINNEGGKRLRLGCSMGSIEVWTGADG